MPEYRIPLGGENFKWENLSEFTQGYIEAAFFCDANPDSEELENATFAELATESLANAIEDCRKFKQSAGLDYESAIMRPGYDAMRAGHDFWFTRNHHGVGFWDRSELDSDGLGDRLTKLAKTFGETGLYRGDCGRVFVY